MKNLKKRNKNNNNFTKKQNKIEFLEDSLLINNEIFVLGDLHIGFEEHISEKGALPDLQFNEIIERLDRIFKNLEKEKIKIKKIIILGDLKHEFGGISDKEWRETLQIIDYLLKKVENTQNSLNFGTFRTKSSEVNEKINKNLKNKSENQKINDKMNGKYEKIIKNNENIIEKHENLDKDDKKNNDYDKILLIKGNHDNILGPIAKKRELKLVDYYNYNDICFMHGNKIFENSLDDCKILILGHLHPSITLSDSYKREKYKCFLKGKWKNKEVYVLPSFSPISFGYDLNNFKYIDEENKGFFIIKEQELKKFEVIIYNNKENKSYNFGKLRKLIKRD